jgi:hypothetical protein
MPGDTLYFAGRLLANYETWLREARDVAPVNSTISGGATSAKSSKSTPAPLPSSGEVEGTIVFFYPNSPMFDLSVNGQRYHITVTPQTAVYVDGKKAGIGHLDLDLTVRIKFRKDRFGRIIASKISSD